MLAFAAACRSLPRWALAVEVPASAPAIEFDCSGRGWLGQGQFEDVPAVGYDNWKAGATAGAAFALATAGIQSARIVFTRISGLTTDTNPSVVGAAAALAVWRALNFKPSNEVRARLEKIVFGSWERPVDEVPYFAEA
jgi:hypothetical protein